MKLQETDSPNIVTDQPSHKTEQQMLKSDISKKNSVSKKLSELEFETFDDVLATSKEMANEIVQNVIKDITAENPHLVSELLAINFSDLIKIFNHLLSTSDSIEHAYRKLFLGLEKFGANKLVEELSEEIKDNPVTNSQTAAYMDVLQNIISNYVGDNKESLILPFLKHPFLVVNSNYVSIMF